MKYSIRIAPENRKDKTGSYIRERVPIMADIKFGGQRLMMSIGYRIDWDDFDLNTFRIKKDARGYEGKRRVSFRTINKRINLIEVKLGEFFENNGDIKKEEIKKEFYRIVKNQPESKQGAILLEDFWKDYILNHLSSKGTKKNSATVLKHWKRFCRYYKYNLDFDLFSVDNLRKFERFLNNGIDDGIKKGINVCAQYLSLTRSFLNFARKELKRDGIIIQVHFGSEGYQMPKQKYGDPIFIKSHERDQLFKHVFKQEHLTRVRDMFVFQCLVGCRISDLLSFTKNNIRDNTLFFILQKNRAKKNETISVPLRHEAQEIIGRYNCPSGKLFPTICPQSYNKYLKEIFTEVGITRIVTRLNPTTNEPEEIPINVIASSHMGRRAFIGNLFGKIDIPIIASMSGHSENSRSFSRYYTVNPEHKKDALDKL